MTAARRPGRDRGETSVETVLLVPVLLLVLFVSAHVASLARAGQVAHVAATRAAETAASFGPTPTGTMLARDAALAVVHDLGGAADPAPLIRFVQGRAAVTVHLHIEGIVPGLPVSVSRTVVVAPETFIDSDVRR